MFVYSKDFVLLEVVTIDKPIKEGWGICNDGVFLYITDGSSYIHKMNPNDYSIVSSVRVYQGTTFVYSLNELEWVNGEIWANIYFSKFIVRVNPSTGEVVGWIDLNGLENNANADWFQGYVLNGIAVNGDKIFVTGKSWSHLFQIELVFSYSTATAPRY